MEGPKGSESDLHYDIKMAIAEVFAKHGYEIRTEKTEGSRRYDVWGTNGNDIVVAEINLNHDPTKIRIRNFPAFHRRTKHIGTNSWDERNAICRKIVALNFQKPPLTEAQIIWEAQLNQYLDQYESLPSGRIVP